MLIQCIVSIRSHLLGVTLDTVCNSKHIRRASHTLRTAAIDAKSVIQHKSFTSLNHAAIRQYSAHLNKTGGQTLLNFDITF